MKIPGAHQIAQERDRQIHREGWTADHDQEHNGGELVMAAIAYAFNSLPPLFRQWVGTGRIWPWSQEWDKRQKHDPMRSLVIAGALIAAEIDRRQELEERKADAV
jgi:hypothetical protein